MASQVSLPSTPQQNTSYDTYMQSLQQKLSSISMQNAATLGPLSPQTTLISLEPTLAQLIDDDKLHVDSSAPTSGTATTEMLSPVQEFEAPVSPPASTNDTPKHTYKSLNNELTKINARKESETQEENDTTQSGSVEKVRRVSRFKVSVVVEPDPAKLIIKPDEIQSETTDKLEDQHTALKQVPSLQDIPSSSLEDCNLTTDLSELHDSVTLINNTMLQLQENVQTSYLTQARTIIAAVPAGWRTENNETFEDMLGRQQAELNALIEAHRKQQIEYMKSITDISKNSNNQQ